jgi:hypothetical protein
MAPRHRSRAVAGIAAVLALLIAPPLPAAHPLITEDTATLGEGGWQLELGNEHITLRSAGAERDLVVTTAALSYGLSRRTDLIMTVPHLRIGADPLTGDAGTHGLVDVGLDLKWRFYEQGPFSFALKPGVTFPTGDTQHALGTGDTVWSLYLVSSYALAKWNFLLHLGHVHHNNTFNERVNLWHASAAVTWQASEQLKLILDTGIDRNVERFATDDPVFVIGGLIYSPVDDFDLDLGYRTTAVEGTREHALLAGLTVRW